MAEPRAQRPPIEQRLASVGLPPLPRPAWLEIDTEALAANLRLMRTLVPPGVRVAAVIKADGYGHGLQVAARTFRAAGADLLCVASVDEAFAVRAAGIDGPLLVLFPVAPDALAEVARAGISVVVGDVARSAELMAAWRERGADSGVPHLEVHLEVETGLARNGVPPEIAGRVAAGILTTPGVRLAGLWSHLASSHDRAFSAAQEERLEMAVASLRDRRIPLPMVHMTAGGGLVAGTGQPHDLVRPGLVLYGELPDGQPLSEDGARVAAALRPALSLHARPIRITEIEPGTPVGYGGRWAAERRSRIATIPVGYGDGYARTSQPGAEALVCGQRVPVVGNVAMDALALDVTLVPGVSLDDEVVLLGAQEAESISATELARRRTTTAYEVFTSMAYRLPRVYDAPAAPTGVRTLDGETLVRESMS